MIGQNAGLPNITGRTYNVVAGSDWTEGALSNTESSFTQSIPAGDSTKFRWLNLNAKNGETKTDGTLKAAAEHHVYGAANGVQPQNISIRLWQRIN